MTIKQAWINSSDDCAWLVVGHGTRNSVGVQQFLNLVGEMRSLTPETLIEGCFLELAEPTIEQSLQAIARSRATRVLVVPVLLFAAGHARHDIPDAVHDAAIPLGLTIVGQTEPLGTHEALISLSQRRYLEVIALGANSPCPSGTCAKVSCESGHCEAMGLSFGRLGLAMVGRGTSDQAALEHMRRLTHLRVTRDNIEIYGTGFFAGGKPDVDSLFQTANDWPCDTVVVQPHLLFEGELTEQLKQKVLELRANPKKNWLIARTLGADAQLAQLFVQFARDEITKNVP